MLFEKVDQSLGQRLDLCNGNPSLLNPLGQQSMIGQLAHSNSVFNRLAGAEQTESAPGMGDGSHSKINPFGKAAVERHLLFTTLPPFGNSGKIKKPQVDSFFYLINHLAG